MKTRLFALHPKKRWSTCPMLVLVLATGCSSSLDNQRATTAAPANRAGQGRTKFRDPQLSTLYQAATASPRDFEPVYAYAKAITDAALASLVDRRCENCKEGGVMYKRRSELEPHYWPIIDEALGMLEPLSSAPGLTLEQTDRLIATKGRLLWLAGRSLEEQRMIDDYASEHPEAVAVIRRRLELLREAGATASVESQCNRSRAKTASAPEAARVNLLTACVAMNPRNSQGRSDLMDYPRFLPNLTKSEETVYRASLVQRCVEKVGDEETRCGEACACENKDSGKAPSGKCRRACNGCRKETSQKLHLCTRIAEAPSAVRTPPPRAASASRPKAAGIAVPQRKAGSRAPRSKDSGLKQLEL